MPLIDFQNVTVAAYGKTLLENISLSVEQGQRVVLRGKSGSGKSTILKCLMGLHEPLSGEILFKDQVLHQDGIRVIRTQAAWIGQEPVLGAETVREAMLLPFRFKAHHREKPPGREELISSLAAMGLTEELLERDCQRISGGEKQRIALARGLLLGKSLFLCDEVTSALDAESREAVMTALSKPGITVFSVAHDPEWINWSNTVYRVESGKIAGVVHHGRD